MYSFPRLSPVRMRQDMRKTKVNVAIVTIGENKVGHAAVSNVKYAVKPSYGNKSIVYQNIC